jgi:uncharacterized membrane protein YfhO
MTGLQVVALSDRLRIEHIQLLDHQGNSQLVDRYVGASNHSIVFRSDSTSVFENYDVLPRAFLLHSAQVLDDAQTLARLRAYTFDPRETALLSTGTPLDDNSPWQGDDESVEMVTYQPERVELAVTAQRPGYVILTDTWYPGWTARLDDMPTTIYRTDYAFRSIKIDAGTHKVEFEYSPASFYAGSAISIITLILLVIGALAVAKK